MPWWAETSAAMIANIQVDGVYITYTCMNTRSAEAAASQR
jgi:hypothetical protein